MRVFIWFGRVLFFVVFCCCFHWNSALSRAIVFLLAARHVKFFQKFLLPELALREVCRTLEYLELAAEEFVFRQGDVGNKYYIILSGSVAISIYDSARDISIVVRVMMTGDSFGELALLSSATRAATVQCREDCTFATLDRPAFKRTMKEPHENIQREKLSFLMMCPVFASTPLEHLKELSLVGNVRKLPPNTVVIQQGESATASGIFLVHSGRLRVVQEVLAEGGGGSQFLDINELTVM